MASGGSFEPGSERAREAGHRGGMARQGEEEEEEGDWEYEEEV